MVDLAKPNVGSSLLLSRRMKILLRRGEKVGDIQWSGTYGTKTVDTTKYGVVVVVCSSSTAATTTTTTTTEYRLLYY